MIVETITGRNNTGWIIKQRYMKLLKYCIYCVSALSLHRDSLITEGNNTGLGMASHQTEVYEVDQTFQIPDGIICKIDLIIFLMLDVFFLDKVAKKYNYMFT